MTPPSKNLGSGHYNCRPGLKKRRTNKALFFTGVYILPQPFAGVNNFFHKFAVNSARSIPILPNTEGAENLIRGVDIVGGEHPAAKLQCLFVGIRFVRDTDAGNNAVVLGFIAANLLLQPCSSINGKFIQYSLVFGTFV